MIVVSFATNDDHYRPFFEQLKDNCEDLGLRNDIRLIEPWSDDSQEHCCHKPAFILDRLLEVRSPVLWLDIDSVIHEQVRIRSRFGDVGYCDNPLHRIYKTRLRAGNDVTGGAMAFRPTLGAIQFLIAWSRSCESRRPGEVADHKRFDRLLKSGGRFRAGDITSDLKGKVTFYGNRGTLALPV